MAHSSPLRKTLRALFGLSSDWNSWREISSAGSPVQRVNCHGPEWARAQYFDMFTSRQFRTPGAERLAEMQPSRSTALGMTFKPQPEVSGLNRPRASPFRRGKGSARMIPGWPDFIDLVGPRWTAPLLDAVQLGPGEAVIAVMAVTTARLPRGSRRREQPATDGRVPPFDQEG